MIVLNDIAHKSLSTIILENSNTQMNSVYHSLNDSAEKKLYCIVLYCIVLYCIILYCIVRYYIVLYYIGLDWIGWYWIGLDWIAVDWIGCRSWLMKQN